MKNKTLILCGCLLLILCNCRSFTNKGEKIPIKEYHFNGIFYGLTPTEVMAAFGKPAAIDSSRPGGYLCEMYHYKDIDIGVTNEHVFEIKTSSNIYEPLGIKIGSNKSYISRVMIKYINVSSLTDSVWQYSTTEFGVYVVLHFNEKDDLVEQGFTIDLP